jgi:hypothetical protein
MADDVRRDGHVAGWPETRRTLRDLAKRWYEGEYIPPDSPPNSAIIISLGHYKRHWTSRAAHMAVEFYLREWEWFLAFIVAVIGILMAQST